MAEAYWTHCMYCHCLICGVEVLEDYPDVLVLYAHKTCHEERKPVDPDAVWTMLCESLEGLTKEPDDRDMRNHAIDCLEILARWLRIGGFPPTITGGDDGKLPGARSCTH
jgi:hypothetical protein